MVKMKSVFLGLSVCLFLVVFVQGQDPPDPCDDLKKQFEELQKKIDENIQKCDDLIRKLENQEEKPDGEKPNPDKPNPKPGENPDVKPGDAKPSDNPVKDSLTDKEWAALVKRMKEQLAEAVKNIKKWLGPDGVRFWNCIHTDARQVLTELMLYLGPREFARQFNKLKGKNYKQAAQIIRNSRWGKQNRAKADALAKRLEAIKAPIKPPDKRQDNLDLDECWPEGSVIVRPGVNRFQALLNLFRQS